MDMTPVSSSLLEERVAMYLQAIEYATATNNSAQRQALEKDIQVLMDLMERISVGQTVPVSAVPPPLQGHSHAGEPLANALGELSCRLADYHKALYYADIEMSGESRTKQIHTLQRGLQVIQKLQEKAQAGFPIRAEEIPPHVPIPTEQEFVVDPKCVITERIALYYQALELAVEEKKETQIKTLQNGIEKLEYLLQRAETNIPIYKKDLPCSPALGPKFWKQTEQYRRTVELLTKMSGLSIRAAKLAGHRGDQEKEKQLLHNGKMLKLALQNYEAGQHLDMSSCPYSLEDIQQLADEAGVPASQHIRDAETVRLRWNQYKLEALKAKRCGHTDLALQHMRVVKGLQSMLHAVERGESVDMTQVPPAPSEQTPTTEEQARILSQVTAAPSEQSPALQEQARILSQVPAQSDHQEFKAEPDRQVDSRSLAEELSSYLMENGLSSESGRHFLWDSSSPTRALPVNRSPSLHRAFSGQQHQHGHAPAQTATPNVAVNSGLNPLYTLTRNTHTVTQTSGLMNRGQTMPDSLQVITSPPVPSRALKPGSGWTDSCPPIPERVPIPSINGFHEDEVIWDNVVPESESTTDDYLKRVDNVRGISKKMSRPPTVESSGAPLCRSETSCIEILKYEGTQLNREGSHEARATAEKLRRHMEETKQCLRVGGYAAWLVYLGQVESDVSSINSQMKQAREGGEQEQLASLVIKKELAERELAVMRKRLPELQT